MLQINDLHVSVEAKEIIKGITLEIKPGEVHAIMGPNGSGKSTTAYALAGHPKYETNQGTMSVDGQTLNDLTADERSRLGLFLATQHPMAVPGLTTLNFLWQIYKSRASQKVSLLEFRKWMTTQAEALGLNPELLKRSLNDGFSGGEKKKTEILQMLVAAPKYVILDEIDSGLDVDALRKIGLTVAKMAKENNIGVLVITHHSQILEYLVPSRVHVIKAGKIVAEGGAELVAKIEKNGFGEEAHVEICG